MMTGDVKENPVEATEAGGEIGQNFRQDFPFASLRTHDTCDGNKTPHLTVSYGSARPSLDLLVRSGITHLVLMLAGSAGTHPIPGFQG
jgi:hypothetical protein